MFNIVHFPDTVSEGTVFICPQGKRAFIYLELCPYYSSDFDFQRFLTAEVYINNFRYGVFVLNDITTLKFNLKSGDTVVVKSLVPIPNCYFNVFVHGVLVGEIV